MKQVLLDIPGNTPNLITVKSVLSFQPFFNHLMKKAELKPDIKTCLYSPLIDRFHQHPELAKPVDKQSIGAYTGLYELIYAAVTGITAEEEDTIWALGLPGAGTIFYGTDALYNLFESERSLEEEKQDMKLAVNVKNRGVALVYSLILERLYGLFSSLKNEVIHHFTNPKTGLPKHYKVNVDTRFMEIKYKGKLPPLNFEELEPRVQDDSIFDYLQTVLPLHHFTFTGFNIVYFTDVTESHAVQRIKNSLLEMERMPKDLCFIEITRALQTLTGAREIKYGFIPFVRLNEKLILEFGDISNSVLINFRQNQTGPDIDLLSLFEDFIQNPKPVFWKELNNKQSPPTPLCIVLQKSEIKSFALLPLFYHNNIVGALEVYSRDKNVLTEKLIPKLDAALPQLAQLLKASIDDFHLTIARIINEKFTSIQPAVQWKFNDAAWRYLFECHIQDKECEIEPITFEKLYPLYGAIDIRNSTVERNNALAEDLRYQLNLLTETFSALKMTHQLAIFDKMTYECIKWLNSINESFNANESYRAYYFLENEAMPYLLHFKTLHPASAAIVDKYLKELDEENGKAHAQKRNLEGTMLLINRTLGVYFDKTQDELQEHYPCYFEKYRTDGIEYDIYIGPSLAPDKPFNLIYLKNLRLWQLQSMAEIFNLIQNIMPEMPIILHVTQLIYVNNEPIDISFRNDEKRFDVESGYNVRYQMIKKRIDKVKIRDSEERLTQPGKIAVVYSNNKDAEEYINYIEYLQDKKILLDDLEMLDLEELQGVSGLKALRVGVATI